MKHLLVPLTVMMTCLTSLSLKYEEWEAQPLAKYSSTIGQICKTAEFAGICVFDQVEAQGDIDSELSWTVQRVMAGNLATGTTLKVQAKIATHNLPTHGRRYLVFVARTIFPMTHGTRVNIEQFMWNFSREEGAIHTDTWHLLGGSRGAIPLNDKPNEVVKVVTAYWDHLRGPTRDIEKYYAFLKEQLLSDVERIRSDARIDIRILMRFPEADILQQMATDEGLDDDLRTSARRRLERIALQHE